MIITLFGPEADPWLKQMPLDQKIDVPGLSADFPQVRCTAEMENAKKLARVVEFVNAPPKSGSGEVKWRQLQEREAAK